MLNLCFWRGLWCSRIQFIIVPRGMVASSTESNLPWNYLTNKILTNGFQLQLLYSRIHGSVQKWWNQVSGKTWQCFFKLVSSPSLTGSASPLADSAGLAGATSWGRLRRRKDALRALPVFFFLFFFSDGGFTWEDSKWLTHTVLESVNEFAFQWFICCFWNWMYNLLSKNITVSYNKYLHQTYSIFEMKNLLSNNWGIMAICDLFHSLIGPNRWI